MCKRAIRYDESPLLRVADPLDRLGAGLQSTPVVDPATGRTNIVRVGLDEFGLVHPLLLSRPVY